VSAGASWRQWISQALKGNARLEVRQSKRGVQVKLNRASISPKV
jgi:hypothetical protein